MSQTQASATIEAPLADVNAVISDLANYPTWSSAITAVKVVESDAQGRATKVEMKVNSGPLRDTVVLDYEWSAAPAQTSRRNASRTRIMCGTPFPPAEVGASGPPTASTRR
jgi:ribosome-associated toxin RatA of RatAB toxin-antitoxin module